MRTEFTYNGLSQRVKIVEKDNGNITSTKNLIWCLGDAQPCEERDGTNTVTKRYYPQGMRVGTTSYYYTRDHLGSIRELTNSSGAVQVRYNYDLYGRRTKVNGSIDADFGFSGHYYHQPSGLHLALYRAYNADLGRWISRDPIEESGGLNLYGYVLNDPTNAVDVSGLDGLIVVIRDGGRDSAGTAYLFDNGQYISSGRVNTNGYYDGSHGLPQGTYVLLPKNNYAPGDVFPAGQPSITDPTYSDPSSRDYAPGRAGPSYKPTVRIHENGPSNGGPGLNCLHYH